MAHYVDAERLVSVFAETDPRMPLLVFSLLSIYLNEGPFEFDAARLAERLSELNLKARVNPEEMASLQSDLERFFEPGADGWRPREGVLSLARGDEPPPRDHKGELPGAHPN
jgi:hypothetical protein